MKADLILSDIESQDLVLPEFQREYVWNRQQANRLIASLLKEYPVGGLLYWKTENPPELKNIKKLPEKLGSIHVLLDGQQRLTTLYLLIKGEIPPYYCEKDIEYDPRELFFNIDSCDLQYYLKMRMEGDPLWRKVVDCFNPNVQINVFEIAKKIAGDDDNLAFQLAQRFLKNLDRLRSIRNMDIPIQIVPSSANLEEAINIFDLTNSQGTKLTDAELALTHITGKWSEARRIFKEKIALLEKRNFFFDLSFMTRALTVIVTRRALFELIHGRPKHELVSGWERLSTLLDYLVTILPGKGHIHSTEDLATTNVLIPLILYLDTNKGTFKDEKTMRHAFYWLYAAQMWARYTAQTDQRLEHDVSIVVTESFPWTDLCNQIIDQRGRIEVKAADLEGRWVAHPLYRMSVVVAKAHGAVDWFNGAPLGTVFGKKYQLHSHHIFPQGLLYKAGYDPDNHLHRKMVNEIANRAFLTAESNMQLGVTSPSDYLPEVEKRYPGSLVKQFVPISSQLWRPDRFKEFLEARRELISQKINEFMNCLIAEPEERKVLSIGELIGHGESATMEFKSTLRWDIIQNKVNKDLQFSVLKTVAAFLNSEGGTLIIGIDDNGATHGLENDLQTFSKPNLDVFEQTFMSLVVEHIGAEFGPLVKSRFEEFGGHPVCVVEVNAASGPSYMTSPKGKEFYVRAGNTSRALDTEETVAYINMHWQ
jgi:hypothetical protein